MALVAAKCPNCGANLEVDATKDAAVCPYCNTAYITQKAIVNYNQTIINNTTINAENVEVKLEKKKRTLTIYRYRPFFSNPLNATLLLDNKPIATNFSGKFAFDKEQDFTLSADEDHTLQIKFAESYGIGYSEEQYTPVIYIPAGENHVWVCGKELYTTKEEYLKGKETDIINEKAFIAAKQKKDKEAEEAKKKANKKLNIKFGCTWASFLISGIVLTILSSALQLKSNTELFKIFTLCLGIPLIIIGLAVMIVHIKLSRS